MTLTITDNGKGMPPEMAARVTDPVLHHAQNAQAVGLGLPFLKMAAEMTGGARFPSKAQLKRYLCNGPGSHWGHIDLCSVGRYVRHGGGAHPVQPGHRLCVHRAG